MKTHPQNPKKIVIFFSTLVYCLSLSWDSSRFYTIVRVVGQILQPVLVIAASYIGKYIVDILTGEWVVANEKGMLFILFTGLLAVAIFRLVGQKVQQYCESTQNDKMNGYLSSMMLSRSIRADLEYIDNPKFHDKFTSAMRDLPTTAHILWNILACISAMVSFLISFAILSQSNIIYGLIMLAAAIPSSIATARYTKSLFSLGLEQLNGERKKNYYQNLGVDRRYAQDLRLFHAEPYLKNRYTTLWKSLFEKKKGLIKKRTIFACLLDLLPEFAVVFIGINIALGVMSGYNTVGDYSLFTGLVSQLWTATALFSFSAIQIFDNHLKIINIKELEHFKNRIEDTGKISLVKIETIAFEHVSFSYPGTSFLALDDISFQLRNEEKVALVGLNGSGKSTLVKLLLRFYEPDKGKILINGINIKEYLLTELHANFTVYFQEMQNFCFTLWDNFIISDGGVTDNEERAISTLIYASCEDIIRKSNGDLHTSITRFFDEDGIELSGGQHQKLALARALYRKNTALILDEPSSNLDPKAEHVIFQSLHTLSEGKMTIFTSHRLSNLTLADRIIVLEGGKIIEDGSQEELLKNKQRYAQLFRYQQEKYHVGEKKDADSNH